MIDFSLFKDMSFDMDCEKRKALEMLLKPLFLGLLSLVRCSAEPRKAQPIPSEDRYQPSLEYLNAYIPSHSNMESDGYMRFLALDCSDSILSPRDFWYLLDRVNPDIAMFIRHPRSPYDQEMLEPTLHSKGYSTRMINADYYVISRLAVRQAEKLPSITNNRVFAADVTLELGPGKTLRLLPISLNKMDKMERLQETMEVLIRAGSIASAQQPFLLLGSTGTSKVEEEAWTRLAHHPLVKDSFAAVNWPAPRFTDSYQQPMDHILVGRSLVGSVLGSYLYYSGMAQHMAVITDISMEAFGKGVESTAYGWERFSRDLWHAMVYWVPLVAVGAILVLVLGVMMMRQERAKKRASLRHDAPIIPVLSAQPGDVDGGNGTGWDVIHMADDGKARKERMASYDPTATETHSSSGISSVRSTASSVVRIQTPPQYPPPPYTAMPEDRQPKQ